ncbi:type VI secretion system baseplate subunit TssF [Trinickia dabaoshanensis]|uniref:Type VI secretion system baseplate subunit TssF n=1 Tax=Trinickia dabaoshanensis TaxID=564714 RepID=A0A2N7VTF2_9BURK|nr:type VI secretion system baseplate subunit TssF [Trinickia dabaoshanensis]PMS20437.1 type VI secretion system baseplate subunit TssF [Trinickia dabaoshanensis]
MNETLLAYYEEELRHLREVGGEFAQAFPKVAQRLGLDAFECADPYVERLLEGFSFLAARVRMRMDAQFPRFTQHLAEMIYPGLLAPTPSMAVVQIEPDRTHPALARAIAVPRGTALSSQLDRDGTTRCEYRTAHALTLLPLRLAQAGYRGFDCLPSGWAPRLDSAPKAVLTLRFEWGPSARDARGALDRLPLYLRGSEGVAELLHTRMTGHCLAGCLRLGEGSGVRYVPLPSRCVQPKGFEDSEALLPVSSAAYRGCRLLREYFAFAQRFAFVELIGLRQWAAAMEPGGEAGMAAFDVVLLLDTFDAALQNSIDAASFALHCTPAINLFARRADRIALDDRRFEHHVVVDRTRPLDFEVFAIEGIDGYAPGGAATRRFAPLYRAGDPGECAVAPGYFQMRRAPRLLSASERMRGGRSRYAGSEVFVALVTPSEAPYAADLQQLGADVLCTNRDLPLSMPVGLGTTDFTGGGQLQAVQSVRCLAGPTIPRPALAEPTNLWRLLDMLSTSRLPLVASANEWAGAATQPAAHDARALRRWLAALCPADDAAGRHQISLLRHASAKTITRRLPLPGPISYGRGLEITLTFDDAAPVSAPASLLGAVLAAALAEYMPINQFAETVVCAPARGMVTRYPAKAGRCEIL